MYSSTILSFRVKGSPSFPSGDHSHPHYDRFDRYGLPFPAPPPSCCCSCCCCCSCYGHCNSSHRVPSSTSFLYGLRQSALLQRSASRTLILNGRDRSYNRCPDYGVEREVSCDSRVRVEKGRKIGSRKKIVVPELSRYEDDAEALLSLLCENVESDSFFGRNRRGGSSMRVEVEKRKTNGTESSKSRKNNVGSNSTASKNLESVSFRSNRRGNVRRKDREELLRPENPKKTCSCSSYYTVSSAGDFESDTEEIKDDRLSDFEYSEETRNKKESKIRRERVQESKKRYEDVKESEFLQKRNSAVKSSAEWDWRKKSEKKLSEVSIGEVESNKQDSRITRNHGYDESKASSSHKRFAVEDEKLNVESRVELKSNSQAASESFGESRQQRTEICTVCGSGVISSSSQPEERLARREESRIASSSGVRDDERRAAAKYPQQHSGKLRIQEIDSEDTSAKYPREHSGALRIHEIDSQNTSAVHRESDTRVSKSEQQNTNVASTSSYKEQKNVQRDEQIRRQSDVRKSTTSSVETRQNIESTFVSNEKHLEENKNSVSYSYPNPREQYPLTTQHSREESSFIQNKSSIEKESIAYSRRTSEEKASDRSSNITLVVNLGEGVSTRQDQTTQEVAQIESRKEDERRTNAPLTISEISLSTNQTVKFIQQDQKQFNLYKGASTSTPAVPPSQLGTGESEYTQRRGKEIEVQGSSPGRVLTQETHTGAADPVFEFVGGSRIDEITQTTVHHNNDEDALGSAQRSEQLSSQFFGEVQGSSPGRVLTQETHTGAADPVFEFVGGSRIDEITQTTVHHNNDEDALGSAQRSEQLSSQFFGEFIQKASSDIVSSQTETSITGTDIVSQDQTQTSSIQHGVEVQLEGNTSGGSVAKGPSEEKWLVTDSTAEQFSKPTHSTAAGGKIVKRTGKSLWAMIADIARLRWGPETQHHPAAQSGKKRPSFESATTSEAYFSGRDHDEKGSTPVEATPSEILQAGQGFSETQTEASSKHFEEPLSRPVTPGSTTSTPTSSVIMQDAFGWHHEDDKRSDPLVESSSHPEALTGKVSPGLEATSVTSERISVSPSGSMEMTEQPGGGELKQRKLQRNKQVLKDRFEEWEEAYVVESEQRMMDEAFMREALIEAKKAADNWEVPVGAVLVQDGKIIARGCNLVEELRDSTAHAEMICIREASNILRAWRLSGTTLYVTLEPCPMCAGAILQARVDTLVWGAPNKLLGADGSWIKLFRDGEEGESSETSEKPQPPVHPFHPKMTIRRGVLASECSDTMQQFFQLRRRNKTKQERPLTPPSCLPVSPNPAKLLRNIFHMSFCL